MEIKRPLPSFGTPEVIKMRSALTFWFAIGVLGLPCTPSAQAEFMELVHVGNVGNAPDTTGYGAVRYPYRIGKFEVTNSQYVDFLNSVATKSDPNGLYSSPMETSLNGGIIRIDQGARYSYVVKDGFGSKPVDWVSFYDSVRFVNWLHNDRPVGEQSTSTTEDGAYTITPESVDNYTLVRNHNARFFIPNENEWYKAAYYNALTDDGSYWLYPTQSNDRPSLILPPGPPNSVNHGLDDRVVTEVGEYDTSPGPYGTFGQGGNVWECPDFALLLGSGSRPPRQLAWQEPKFES